MFLRLGDAHRQKKQPTDLRRGGTQQVTPVGKFDAIQSFSLKMNATCYSRTKRRGGEQFDEQAIARDATARQNR